MRRRNRGEGRIVSVGDDPAAVDPRAIRDIRVWGSVLAGRKQPA